MHLNAVARKGFQSRHVSKIATKIIAVQTRAVNFQTHGKQVVHSGEYIDIEKLDFIDEYGFHIVVDQAGNFFRFANAVAGNGQAVMAIHPVYGVTVVNQWLHGQFSRRVVIEVLIEFNQPGAFACEHTSVYKRKLVHGLSRRMVRMFFLCVEQPCMTSLPNEEAKIEQLIRQLATISPPFVNSREQLKQLAASIYLLADQLTDAVAEETSEEIIIDLPPLNIPESRPIFADHSNPVPAVSEESIEEELQWQAVPTSPAPSETIPAKLEVPVAVPEPVETPVADPTPTMPTAPPVEPEPLAPEIRSNPEPRDLFEQANIPPVVEVPLVQVPRTIPAAEPFTTPPAVETPNATPEPVQMPVEQEEPKSEPTEKVEPPVPVPPISIPPVEPLPPPPADPIPTPQHAPVPAPQTAPLRTPGDRDLQRALPLVRRLEFINRLFNGNDGEWQLFCQEVNRCHSTSDALQIYRESYIRYGWEKHAEMADLLKQLIVKTFG